MVVFGNPLKLSGQTIAAASPTYGPKAEEFCTTDDPVCGNGTNILAHLAYLLRYDSTQGRLWARNPGRPYLEDPDRTLRFRSHDAMFMIHLHP